MSNLETLVNDVKNTVAEIEKVEREQDGRMLILPNAQINGLERRLGLLAPQLADALAALLPALRQVVRPLNFVCTCGDEKECNFCGNIAEEVGDGTWFVAHHPMCPILTFSRVLAEPAVGAPTEGSADDDT